MPDTIVTCRDFIKAVETENYGWLWECPNGGNACTYRHQLPEGYLIQRGKKEPGEEDEEDKITLEEQLELDRDALKYEDCTPVTLESFTAWKQRRDEKKIEDALKKQKEEESAGKKSKGAKQGFLNGRTLFSYDPNLFKEQEEFDENEKKIAQLQKAINDDDDEETKEDGNNE